MVESSDLQSAIQRTQATERIASLQNQQEDLNRKRFELEIARERAEKSKKAQNVDGAKSKRVVKDRYEGEEPPRGPQGAPGSGAAGGRWPRGRSADGRRHRCSGVRDAGS